MEATSWYLADDGKETNPFFLFFCFALSQECSSCSIHIPNEELVFKHLSACLRPLMLRNLEKIVYRRTEIMFFLLLSMAFLLWDLC